MEKQEQTLFKRSAAGFNKVLIAWQRFSAARKQKSLKILKKTCHNGLKICTVCHIITVYKCYFRKIIEFWKKLNNNVVPPRRRRRRTTSTVPWSGLRKRQNTTKIDHYYAHLLLSHPVLPFVPPDDVRPWRLTQPLVRDPHHRHVRHRRVRAQEVLQLGRGDLRCT